MNRCLRGYHYNKRAILFLAITVLLILPPPIFSQDNTPTDAPTATETPSATATFSETPTATETASATPSETATSTATFTETPTETATPTETPTALLLEAPTLTPTLIPTSTPTTAQPLSIPPELYPTPLPTAQTSLVAPGEGFSPLNGGNYAFATVSTVDELRTEIPDTCDPNVTVVIRMISGTYTINAPETGTTSGFLIRGNCNIIIIGQDSYDLGLHPDDPALPAGNKVIIERNSSAGDMDIFTVADAANLTLYNLILRNGGGPTRTAGGGIINNNGLFVYDSVLEGHTAVQSGGAIFNNNFVQGGIQNGTGAVTVINTIFRNNATTLTTFVGIGGGAIGLRGGTLEASCVIFEDNFARDGGAINTGLYGAAPSAVSVETVNFLSNTGDGYSAARNADGAGRADANGASCWHGN